MKMLVTQILFGVLIRFTTQLCPEENSHDDMNLTLQQNFNTSHKIELDPLCQNNSIEISNCSESNWTSDTNFIEPLSNNVLDQLSCPPGHFSISEQNNDYCYQIGKHSTWNSPCYTSGGASVITDLTNAEVEHLLHSLTIVNTSRYFWLPAARQKLFNPIVWSIPGPNWGRQVQQNNILQLQFQFTKNCLLLDIVEKKLVTEACIKIHPSLCFYINQHNSMACPEGYHSFLFKNNINKCYGIEQSDSKNGMSFDDFLKEKCPNPIEYSKHESTRFIFKKIMKLHDLPNNASCWIKTQHLKSNNNIENICNLGYQNSSSQSYQSIEGVISAYSGLRFINTETLLPCMACEAEMVSNAETEFMFEYNILSNKIYLTVYYPSGLRKYNSYDKGIQCFSDAKGFVRVIDVNDQPLIELKSEVSKIEKVVYLIDLVTDSFARYWCEGHTFNFSLVTTEKLVVNPKGNKVHVFSLVMKIYDVPDFDEILGPSIFMERINTIFEADTILLMDILEYTTDFMMILLHLHVTVEEIYINEAQNILHTYEKLKYNVDCEFPKHNYTFVNMSSSIYCLPTTSTDIIMLEWELAAIGYIAAPKQFCLQSNGLPVKRRCSGSYMLGSFWNKVEGQCDSTYIPTETTTFLYNFVKKLVPTSNDTKFLTDGLSYVLGDTEIIIPADVYYLSVSLQKVLNIADENMSSIDTGNIDNIAWIMDRVMIIDNSYLGLAQTLNSTNVIIDSITDIIEVINQKNFSDSNNIYDVAYQIAVQPNFLVQISYPEVNNITGIAVIKNTNSDDFSDMLIKPLYKNTSLDEIAAIENIEVAAWLPTRVLETMRNNMTNNTDDEDEVNKNCHIIITLYYNNVMFQEPIKDKHRSTSRVIGITVPGYISNLEYPVLILFRQSNVTENTFCGYWDFEFEHANDVPGTWKKQGCYMVDIAEDFKVCECYHLTHFGQLLYNPHSEIDDITSINRSHSTALNVITLAGSFLSLLGIVGIWLTALVFRSWRRKAGTKVLLQLSTSIALPLLLIIIFNLDDSLFIQEDNLFIVAEQKRITCIVLGALFHFSILASFVWMLITAILQFIRYVRVLGVRRPARFMFKFTIIGWGIPLIPVCITLTLKADNYVPDPSLIRRICYPTGMYLFVSVLFPICLILSINIILFILVLNAISRGPDQKMKCTDMDLVGAQLRVSIFLFFLLGLTWIFGVFSFSSNLMWSYLFCLTSTLQGFVLFIYFVICDPNTRHLWITLMKPQFTTNSRHSISSISTG